MVSKTLLKAELHCHLGYDPGGTIPYSDTELIDYAAARGFQVLGITCHDYVFQNKETKKYARSKGILLLSGVERTIKGKHVLIYDISPQEAVQIHTFEELKVWKQKHPQSLVIAPHPFHLTGTCLKEKILKYLDLFDAWEYSWFYVSFFNPNKRTVNLARKYHKPLTGSSDVHRLNCFGRTYTLIDAPKTQAGVFKAIREGKVDVVTESLPLGEFLGIMVNVFLSKFRKTIRGNRNPRVCA